MNAPVRRLPVLHAEVTEPSDPVRCEVLSTTLSAKACAERTLALKIRPGHRRAGRVMAGIARYGACARCDLGSEARARLAIAGVPGRVEVLTLPDLDDGTAPERPAPKPLTAREEAFLERHGWTRDGARWLDQHGTSFPPHVALELAARDRVYMPTNIGTGRRRATEIPLVVRGRVA